MTVDTYGRTVADTVAQRQVTSPVPVSDGVIAALGNQLVHIDRKGGAKTLVRTSRAPYDIHALPGGKIAFLDRTGNTTTHAKTHTAGKVATVATGKVEQLALKQAGTSRVFLTGKLSGTTRLSGSGVSLLDAPAEADVSSLGRLAVNPVLSDAVQRGLDNVKNAGKGFTNPSAHSSVPRTGRSRRRVPVSRRVRRAVTGRGWRRTLAGIAGSPPNRVQRHLRRSCAPETERAGRRGHGLCARSLRNVVFNPRSEPPVPRLTDHSRNWSA